MRTDFDAGYLTQPEGKRANEILRSCVHCGFCNATCPTYQVTGDELDGPRGRIYLIREFLQSGENQDRAQFHLDRCLTCRACETTCPSGVAYGELAEIARNKLGPNRSGVVGVYRFFLNAVLPRAGWLRGLMRVGRPFKWLLPSRLRQHLPKRIFGKPDEQDPSSLPADARTAILLHGCAQQVTNGQTNKHLLDLLTRHGVRVISSQEEVCCGSAPLHLGDDAQAQGFARENVDWLYEQLPDAPAILSTASGCGVTVKDYGRLLEFDPVYAERAKQVSQHTLDVAEFLQLLEVDWQPTYPAGTKVAWQAPCSLQHGQKINGAVEAILSAAGYELVPVSDSHLCCGSAGTYSVLQPELSGTLRANKLTALMQHQPEIIASANVGCQSHLGAAASVPVLHWIELIK